MGGGGSDDRDKDQDEKDLELDLMAEQELLRLTRQYRVIHHNCMIENEHT